MISHHKEAILLFISKRLWHGEKQDPSSRSPRPLRQNLELISEWRLIMRPKEIRTSPLSKYEDKSSEDLLSFHFVLLLLFRVSVFSSRERVHTNECVQEKVMVMTINTVITSHHTAYQMFTVQHIHSDIVFKFASLFF